jgi:hypothetical protein
MGRRDAALGHHLHKISVTLDDGTDAELQERLYAVSLLWVSINIL